MKAFKQNPYGSKSIQVASSGYHTIVEPVVPYAQKPYSYVAPYVARADSLADQSLDRVDQHFPIVKQETSEIKGTVMDYATWPFVVALNGKNYVLKTYGDEYKKCGGDGVVASGKAVITTGLVITSDSLNWLSGYLAQKKGEAKEAVKETQQ
jgi:hypothetical protein